MNGTQLIFLLGSEGSGLYTAAKALRTGGLNVGEPRPELANAAVVRHQPDHGHLWQWQALRRCFNDLGLPPVAEIPPDLLSPDEKAYHAGVFARCLRRSLDAGAPFVYADHLGALALPLLVEAAGMLGVSWSAWFFFSHPAGEMARLRQEQGVPLPLAEFIWRNVATSAILHSRDEIRYVDMEAIRPAAWRALYAEITGADPRTAPPLPAPAVPPAPAALSPLTARLYECLAGHAGGSLCLSALREAALTAHRAQVEQNGWQYVDCLDCGELDAQARRLLARAGAVAGTEPASGTPGQEGTADLLDAAQRELLRQKQDFAARLFLHSQSLRIRYQNALEDMRLRHESELAALKEAARRRSRRRKELLRRLLEKARLS